MILPVHHCSLLDVNRDRDETSGLVTEISVAALWLGTVLEIDVRVEWWNQMHHQSKLGAINRADI
jgi:hypothetical protein